LSICLSVRDGAAVHKYVTVDIPVNFLSIPASFHLDFFLAFLLVQVLTRWPSSGSGWI